MASTVPMTGNGVTIAFGTSSFTAEIVSFTPPGWSRESIETSHAGTTDAKTFMPADLVDYGELSMTIHFNPDLEPPVDGAAETITITFAGGGATWAFSGFMTAYEPGDADGVGDEKIEADITVKVSGAITVTPAA